MTNLDLIDWGMVGFSSLWILGLAILLSVLGFAYYNADQPKTSFRGELRSEAYQKAINGALTLVCLGLLGSARAWWERIIWALLALSFLYFFLESQARKKR